MGLHDKPRGLGGEIVGDRSGRVHHKQSSDHLENHGETANRQRNRPKPRITLNTRNLASSGERENGKGKGRLRLRKVRDKTGGPSGFVLLVIVIVISSSERQKKALEITIG